MKWTNKGHEFDKIGEMLLSIKKIYFYGIGGFVQEIWGLLERGCQWFDWETYFVDRNEIVREKGFNGNSILDPDYFFAHIGDETSEYLVIACPIGKVGDEIKNLVIENGVKENRVVSGFDFLFTYIPIYFMYRHNILFFTSQNIVPSSACNLNCRDCLNFNPYIKKPVVYNLEEVKADVDAFFGAVDLIYRFQVTGGEPLLYPHFRDVLEYIDNNYRNKIFRLETVTNGTVIPDDEICSFLGKKGIYVYLDDYTLSLTDKHKITRELIIEKFKKFNVEFEDNYVDKWFKIFPDSKRELKANLGEFFDLCGNPWSTVFEGKITACNYSLYATKAGINKDEETDYYDLRNFNSNDKKKLLEFRLRYNEKGFTTFCDKCAGFSVINENYYYPAIQAERKSNYVVEQ